MKESPGQLRRIRSSTGQYCPYSTVLYNVFLEPGPALTPNADLRYGVRINGPAQDRGRLTGPSIV